MRIYDCTGFGKQELQTCICNLLHTFKAIKISMDWFNPVNAVFGNWDIHKLNKK